MKLSILVNNIDCKVIGKDVEISYVTFDCKKVKEKTLFVSLKPDSGEIGLAIKRGASAVVSKKEVCGVTSVLVNDERIALSYICASFYGYKKSKISVIGVIGTNGKTSTATMLSEMLEKDGKKVATICTGKATIDGEVYETDMTTPDPPELFELIGKMIAKKIKYCIMEVSAHAIFFKKTNAIEFDYLIYTNCTQDHLDFFKTFERYKEVKKSYFVNHSQKYVVNSDDKVGVEILQDCRALTYGLENPSDVFAIDVKQKSGKTSFILNMFDDIEKINLNCVGLFNVYNFLGSATTAYCLGVQMKTIKEYAKQMQGVKGRCELVGEFNGGKIYVDYAHTPDGLEKLIGAFKQSVKGRLICLFGCGGNRDSDKRPKMGKIAGKNADFSIITSDNPRYEEPCQIISDIEKGIRETNGRYITIQNRKEAINYAINLLQNEDVLLIAGKGDERYQEIMGTKHEYSDREVVKSVLNFL